MKYGFLIFFIPLLLMEGFFAASELALISANRRRLRHRAEEGYRGAKLALKLLARPEYMMATTLLGAYMLGAVNSILVTAFLLDLLGSRGEILALIILPPVILIFGEIIPKSIGRQQANLLAERLAPALWTASWVIYPITIIFASLSRVILYITGARKTGHLPFITREDLRLVVAKSGPEVDLERKERLFIHRILQFSLRTVKEVMVPLIRVVAIPDTLTVGQALEEFRNSRFSRLPVYHRRIDNLIGVVHDFDLLGEGGQDRAIRTFMRPVNYVPELKKIDRLLAEMQRQGTHLAVVVDEYGGAVGIVTIEDLLEEIVGEITDEFDQEVAPYKKLGEGHYLISARTEIKVLNEVLHLDLPPGDYETLAGFLISQLGELPRAGEHLQYRNLKFTVRQAEARAVKEVELFVDGTAE
ncbi:MAG: hemolysin family protein [Syntrophobacterales bacterium]|jgi:CBS domain containing-hemolysin-like protein|nr:hemolysin family protein [Syntrophobacterales bacterium]